METNTVIGEGITFNGGSVKGINGVKVSGLCFSDIDVDGEVIIDETGFVKGNINATFAVVSGIVEGDLKLSSYAAIKSTGSVTGNISCTSISIEDGAVFCGNCTTIVNNNAINKRLKKITGHTGRTGKESFEKETPEKQEEPDETGLKPRSGATVREMLKKA